MTTEILKITKDIREGRLHPEDGPIVETTVIDYVLTYKGEEYYYSYHVKDINSRVPMLDDIKALESALEMIKGLDDD